MNGLLKIALIGAGIIGAQQLFAKGSALNRAREKMVTEVKGRKGSMSSQGVYIELTYNLKNPSKTDVEIIPPLIKLMVGGKVLASNDMNHADIPESARTESGRIRIAKFKETGEIRTQILIPWLSVLMHVGSNLMTRLQSNDEKDKVPVTVETNTHVYTLGAGNYPYDEQTTIML